LAQRVAAGLIAVEARLLQAADSDYGFLAQTSRHLLEAGGKRLRPTLVLLGAETGDPYAAGVVEAGVVVELTHLATLYHDDVMDEAPRRRGAESANARYGNTVAILTGDFLFARASDMLADLGPEAVRLQARTFERLVAGQIAETVGPREGVDPVEHYLHVLADKTGSLIATSARFGAMFGGASPAVVEALTSFGEAMGVAFQISDDIIDIASDGEVSGKTPGTDLREGVPTFPTLLVQRNANSSDARLLELLSGPVAEDDVAETLSLLRSNPAIEAARAELDLWLSKARAELAVVSEGAAKRALTLLTDSLGQRAS
jgi:heptaprenyl diphosphate synthase